MGLVICNDTVSEIDYNRPPEIDLNKLKYHFNGNNPVVWPRNYQNRYLTFTALEPSDKRNYLHIGQLDGVSGTTPTLEFSTNLNEWYPMKTGSSQEFWYGHPLYIRGVDIKHIRFIPTDTSWNASKYKVSGSIFSLWNYSGEPDEDEDWAKLHECSCKDMFKQDCLIKDASELELPAEVLCDDMCNSMFYKCISLEETPVLPYANSSYRCFKEMFKDCTSLTEAPALPCMNLYPECYKSMFEGCTALRRAPVLPAKLLKERCYEAMFYNSGIEFVADISHVTKLEVQCCGWMYYGCNNIYQVDGFFPKIPLADFCYVGMFMNCKTLKNFYGLQGTTTSLGCCKDFFNGCSNLIYVSTGLTYYGGVDTDNWLLDVHSYGVFHSMNGVIPQVIGPSGIPEGWTIL